MGNDGVMLVAFAAYFLAVGVLFKQVSHVHFVAFLVTDQLVDQVNDFMKQGDIKLLLGQTIVLKVAKNLKFDFDQSLTLLPAPPLTGRAKFTN